MSYCADYSIGELLRIKIFFSVMLNSSIILFIMKMAHWFLPSKSNKFHPIALRPVGLAILLAVTILIQPLYNITSAKQAQVLGYATSVSVADIHHLSNQERINNGLPPLNLHSQLSSAAYAKANDMFAKNYWAHISPDGTTPWYFISSAGYSYAGAGENLAKDFSLSSGVVAGWMGSPAHRANILSTTYQDVGYAVVNGTLQGSETTLVVAMYGQPPAPTPAQAPAPTASVSQPTSTPPPSQPAPIQTTPATPATETPVPQQSEPTGQSDATPVTAPTQKKYAPTPAEVVNTAPQVGSASTTQPIHAYVDLNWGQKASLLLMSTVLLLFILKHTMIWRQQKRGLRNIWLRAHPLGQASVLAAALIITLANGVGVIL
jgi:uncharacterized protein YkwD